MKPEKEKEAHALGVRMFKTDEWLKNALTGANEALKSGGKEGLILVVRELSRDDHFSVNWLPLIKRASGGKDADTRAYLYHVWQGFADAYMDTYFAEPAETL